MAGDSSQHRSKRASQGMEAPACVHAYVWVFMAALGVGPALCVEWVRRHLQLPNAVETYLIVSGLVQAMLWVTQRRCSTQALSYWDGMLVAAASVTTGENLGSLLRALLLLSAVVITSLVFAVDHDERCGVRHAGIRFANLIICIHQQRLRRNRASPQ